MAKEEKVECGAGGVKSPIKVTPLAFDPDVGLIYPPTVVGRFEFRAQTSFHFRGVTLHPPPNGNVVDQKSALGQEFLHVSVGQRKTQVPPDRKQNDLRFKLAPLEQAANRRVQKEHPASLSRRDCKVATLPRTVLTILLKNAFSFELRDRQRITGVSVGIDYAGRGMVLPAQGFRQKALSRYCVAFSRQKKVDRRTAGVHGPVQIYPLALDADV